MRFLAAIGLLGLVVLAAYAISWSGREVESEIDVITDSPVAVDGDLAAIEPPADAGSGAVVQEPPVIRAAPDLVDLDGWLQTEAASLADIDAPVKIVQFWTFGCYNCKNTIPYLQDIYASYHDQGLEIIGVHAPEFAYEADPANIAAAAVDLGVTWPIALDTDKINFRSWQSPRRFWPRTYVIDADGNIRFDRIGEGAYDELEATVAFLIADANA